jgi:tRNA A22 N-methylase
MNESRLRRFADEEGMFEAVKEALVKEAKAYMPVIANEPDEVLGQKYRAYSTAIELIEKSFNKLAQHKGQKPAEKLTNLAR